MCDGILYRMRHWKNFENQLIFGEDNGQWLSGTFFWDSVCIIQQNLSVLYHILEVTVNQAKKNGTSDSKKIHDNINFINTQSASLKIC